MNRNYSEIFDKHEAMMLQDTDNAITKCDLWEWLKNYEPEDGKGFSFSNHPNLDRISKSMKYEGHSGSSYSWCMRVMERIAKDGWEPVSNEYRIQKKKADLQKEIDNIKNNIAAVNKQVQISKEKISALSPVNLAEILQDKLPNGKEQYEAMKNFSEGKMNYAEMRRLCG